jgi:hypothetical protein
MNRIKGLLRDTWWLWTIFLIVGAVGAIWIDWVFLAAFPISLATIAYFASVRYDDQGRPR